MVIDRNLLSFFSADFVPLDEQFVHCIGQNDSQTVAGERFGRRKFILNEIQQNNYAPFASTIKLRTFCRTEKFCARSCCCISGLFHRRGVDAQHFRCVGL